MLDTPMIKVVPIAVGLLFLGACATVDSPQVASKDISVASKAIDTKAPDSSKPVAPTKTASSSKATKSKYGMICKRRPRIGSKFNREVCYTKEDWEKLSTGGKDATDKYLGEHGFERVRLPAN